MPQKMDPQLRKHVKALAFELEELHRESHEATLRWLQREDRSAPDSYDYEAKDAREKAIYEELVALNDSLKSQGFVPGRMVEFAAADGYATYVVGNIGAKDTEMIWIAYPDTYMSDAVWDGKAPTGRVETQVEFNDKWR